MTPDKAYIQKELAPAQIKTDLEVMGKVVDLLEGVFSNPWAKESNLTTLSTGVAATTAVRNDLLQAREQGQKTLSDFVISQCSSLPTANFFDCNDSHQGSCAYPTKWIELCLCKWLCLGSSGKST